MLQNVCEVPSTYIPRTAAACACDVFAVPGERTCLIIHQALYLFQFPHIHHRVPTSQQRDAMSPHAALRWGPNEKTGMVVNCMRLSSAQSPRRQPAKFQKVGHVCSSFASQVLVEEIHVRHHPSLPVHIVCGFCHRRLSGGEVNGVPEIFQQSMQKYQQEVFGSYTYISLLHRTSYYRSVLKLTWMSTDRWQREIATSMIQMMITSVDIVFFKQKTDFRFAMVPVDREVSQMRLHRYSFHDFAAAEIGSVVLHFFFTDAPAQPTFEP